MRQHDAGATDSNSWRGGGDCRHEYLWRRADDVARVVMLRDPVAMITQRVAVAREFEGLADRGVLRFALGRRGLVEY